MLTVQRKCKPDNNQPHTIDATQPLSTRVNNISGRNIPQTTKTQKCQIKRNFLLVDTGKENMPLMLEDTRRFVELESDGTEDKERTVKFVSVHGHSSKRKKCFIDDDKSAEEVNVKYQQKQQQIDRLAFALSQLQTVHEKSYQLWSEQKQQLQGQLSEMIKQNIRLRQQINSLKLVEAKSIEILPAVQTLHQSSMQIQLGVQYNKCQISISKLKQKQQSNDNIATVDSIVSGICSKVQQLESQLQFFIDLTYELKERLSLSQMTLHQKQQQLSDCREAIAAFTIEISEMKNQHQQRPALSEQQQQLAQQLNSYKFQYEQLKRRHFLLAQQYTKYTATPSHTSRYQMLEQQYNCLYLSYKSLYEEYMNKSREMDFVMELNESDQEESVISTQQRKRSFNRQVKKERLVHCPEEMLEDCEGINMPMESTEECEDDSSRLRIVLSDLIQETMGNG